MQQFLENNSLFVVLSIVLIIWFGISLLLFYLDRKIMKIERTINIDVTMREESTGTNNNEIQSKDKIK